MKDKASILLVDDDVGMLETLHDILDDLGYNVEVANNGFIAIEKVKARSFDAILMDIKMPKINGVETYKEIKNIKPEIAVLMMTAHSVDSLINEALNEGAYGVVYKPIDIAKIVEFIKCVTEGALILIVDDDLSTCEILLDVLKEKGFQAVKANNGNEAIEFVKERDFDVVFIDIKMPLMNGLEVYLALKKIKSNIKVIMMTGYRHEVQDLVDQAIENSAYTCIYKPFEVENVLKVLREIKRLRFFEGR